MPPRAAARLLAGLFLAAAASPAAPLLETVTVHAPTPRNRPNHRIPALVTAPNGDVLLFTEKRNDGIGDIGDHDLVLVRSRDLGRTWGPEELIFDDGPATCTDTTVCVDRERGRIFAFFLRDKKRYAYFASDDSGRTWCGPVDIHEAVTQPGWDAVGLRNGQGDSSLDPESAKTSRTAAWGRNWVQRYGVGPGAGGIQLQHGPKRGRLIIPARHKEALPDGTLDTFSHVFLSDDHGETWRLGPTVARHGNECRLVELPDGTVMLNMRNADEADQPDNSRRLVALSRDGGETWEAPYRDDALVSTTVHAGLRVYERPGSPDDGLLLFSNPASPIRQKEHPYGRYNLTVRWSRDGGGTWSAGRVIYPHPSSYSDLTVLPDGTIGLVYERGPKGGTHYWDEIQFVRFNLEWLLAPAHTPAR
jgi:sialidase-1